jgi:Xaa-Pro aminopeptidase
MSETERIAQLRRLMAETGLEGLIVLAEENRRYLSGFRGQDGQFDESAGALFIDQDHLVLATDSRYTDQARQEAPLFELVVYRQGLPQVLPDLVSRSGARQIGFEGRRLSVHDHTRWNRALASASPAVVFTDCDGLVERLRAVKSEDEIDATRRSLALSEKAFEAVIRNVQPGIRETELAWSLEKAVRDAGAQGMAFPSICAAGPNSALPHAHPGNRRIRSGEPILIDWGVRLDGYCSDTTRTIVIGPPDDTFKRVYRTVKAALEMAVAAIEPGASGKAVDRLAREYIDQCGFKDRFTHSLGHGTGLAVHESPRLSPLRDDRLEAGMIVTVEPGIYLPEWGGIRLENQVAVRAGGAEVLNRLPFMDL